MKLDEAEIKKLVKKAVDKGWARYPSAPKEGSVLEEQKKERQTDDRTKLKTGN